MTISKCKRGPLCQGWHIDSKKNKVCNYCSGIRNTTLNDF